LKPWKVALILAVVAAVVYVVPVAWRLRATYFGPLIGSATLTGVKLSPATVALVPTQAIQFSVAGRFSDGSQKPIAVTFSATGGTVTSDALYTAGSTVGEYRVIAVVSGGTLSDTSVVTITPLSTAPDKVTLTNQVPATGSATVLIDGPRSSGCANDDVFLGAGSIDVGSLLAPKSTCPAEVAVFSSGNAMALDTAVKTWTNNGGDVRPETLKPPIRVPVVIWVDTLVPSGTNGPLDDLKDAMVYFLDNKAGVDFDTTAGTVKTVASATARRTIGYSCDSASAARRGNYYLAGVLNVYYVHDIHLGASYDKSTAPRGWNCVDHGAPNQLYVSMIDRANTTLAHEIGHALGLQVPYNGHTDWLQGFDESNLMWSYQDVIDRDHIALGQAYRISADSNSWLNLPPSTLRTGQPARDCGCNPFHDRPCPVLARDGAGPVTTGLNAPGHAMVCKIELCSFTSNVADCTSLGVTQLSSGVKVDLPVGGTIWFRSTGRDTLDESHTEVWDFWASSDPQTATITTNGMAFGVQPGCAVMSDWIDGVRANLKVDVGSSGAC